MKYNLNTHLIALLAEGLNIKEANILGILTLVKKKLSALLKEDQSLTEDDFQKYLKIVALFEQFFRYLISKKVNLLEIPGLKKFLDNNNLENVNEAELTKSLDKVLEMFKESNFSNFKSAVEHRFKNFVQWSDSNDRGDLKIVDDAVDFTIKTIESYLQGAHHV